MIEDEDLTLEDLLELAGEEVDQFRKANKVVAEGRPVPDFSRSRPNS